MTPNNDGRLSWRDLNLEDLFTKGEFAKTLLDTRWQIIRVFTEARSGRGRRATKGYIVGLNDQLASLATYIQRSMSKRAQDKIFSAEALQDILRVIREQEQRAESETVRQQQEKLYVKYQCHTKQEQESLVRLVRFEIFMRLLVQMRDTQAVWYVNGEWWIPQTVTDEYLRRFKGAKKSFRNQRNFHGRPSRDRGRLRRLRVAPGVSIGW